MTSNNSTTMTEQTDTMYTGRASMRRLMNISQDDERPLPSAPSEIDVSDLSILSTEPLFPCHITDRQVPLNTSTPRQYGRRQLTSRSGSIQDSSDVNATREANDTIAADNVPTPTPTVPAPTTNVNASATSNNTNNNNTNASRLREYELSQQNLEHPLGFWKNGMSSMLACLGTTIGLFNISRFAILSVQFGANFILQFMILSLLVGIPLFTFHVSLGQLLAKGCMQMWKISPVFRGIGISLLMSQLMIGVYSSIGITWMLVYFKDSFITKQDVYRWAVPIDLHRFRDSNLEDVFPHVPINLSFNIRETTADYFHGVVLQRYGSASNEKLEPTTNINYSLALNSAVVWIIVCICLRKGLKLYGKVIFLYTLFPIFGLFIFCAKLLRLTNPTEVISENIQDSDWTEFFLNTKRGHHLINSFKPKHTLYHPTSLQLRLDG
uniref:Sodium-dependent proline transporter n=1 Tax=Cacopsylla melanoneura TaxID=428564 RepID=A0A8D8YXH3_9HEMI